MIESGFWSSREGDRKYNTNSFNGFFEGILTDGVYKNSGEALAITAGEGLKVNVCTGKARIKEHWINVDAVEELELAVADVANSRYDAVILRYNAEGREINLQVLQGESATEPIKPEITRNENIYDICLAYIKIEANASTITEIEDTRADVRLCGYTKLRIDGMNAKMNELRKLVTLEENTKIIELGIQEYDSENDVLLANVNGIALVPEMDYTINGTGAAAQMTFTRTMDADNTIEIRILQAVIEAN